MQSRTVGAYLAEGAVATGLADIQNDHPDIDIGSYPFYKEGKFGTSLVLRGTDVGELEEATAKVADMISDLGGEPISE